MRRPWIPPTCREYVEALERVAGAAEGLLGPGPVKRAMREAREAGTLDELEEAVEALRT